MFILFLIIIIIIFIQVISDKIIIIIIILQFKKKKKSQYLKISMALLTKLLRNPIEIYDKKDKTLIIVD